MPATKRSLVTALSIAGAMALTVPLGADAEVSEPRRVNSYVTATCKSWVNSVSATVVCQDISYRDLPVGTCISRSCGNDSGGVAKFADGRYEGAFDGNMPGKGHGRLERNDGVVVEGSFRRGEMWEVTAYFPDGVLWKGAVASETGRNSFGTWSAYRDEGGTRSTGVIRYGSLFAKPDASAIADGQARLNGGTPSKAAPKAPGTDLTPIFDRSKGLTAVTRGEHADCWGLYVVLNQSVGEYGRLGLPPVMSPEAIAKRVKFWEKTTKALYKKDGAGGAEADRDRGIATYRAAYDVGNLDLIADMSGVCVADPRYD